MKFLFIADISGDIYKINLLSNDRKLLLQKKIV